jgi:IS66 C-terminal element/Transposase IS66 family
VQPSAAGVRARRRVCAATPPWRRRAGSRSRGRSRAPLRRRRAPWGHDIERAENHAKQQVFGSAAEISPRAEDTGAAPTNLLFLEDGRLELDTNVIERAIRPIALGRKNALFAGSDGGAHHWAIVASLVATAKLNGVEPLAWLTDVLEHMVSGRTKTHELERLLPWHWKTERLAAAARAWVS